jgi:hypothetical protein
MADTIEPIGTVNRPEREVGLDGLDLLLRAFRTSTR